MPTRRLQGSARTAVVVALAAWAVLLALTLLAPSATGPSWLVATLAGLAEDLGLPAAVTAPGRMEFVLNVAAFVPLSFLGSLLWTRPSWRDWTAAGFVASFAVEAAQAAFLTGRSATHVDVVSNTLGALAGAVLGGLLVRVGTDPASEDGSDLPDRHSPTQQLEPPG